MERNIWYVSYQKVTVMISNLQQKVDRKPKSNGNVPPAVPSDILPLLLLEGNLFFLTAWPKPK